MDPDWSRVVSATAELMVITSNDVPTASGIEKRSARTSAGTITNPPPTPKKPVSSPTTVPAKATRTIVARSRFTMWRGAGPGTGFAAAPSERG